MPTKLRPTDLFHHGSLFDRGLPDAAPFGLPPGQDTLGQTLLYAPDGGSTAKSGGSGRGGGGTTTSPSTAPSATTSSGLTINISWDSSVSAAPAAFKSGVLAAASYLQSMFSDKVTVNIAIGYGEVGGTALGSGALGASQTYLTSYGYSSLATAVTNDATSADDKSVAASLPGSSPISGGNFWATTAQAKALGLAAATGTSLDGYCGFSSTYAFDYSTADGISAGAYDFNGTVLHELTEVMGRMMFTGGTIGSSANSYTLMDLLHYSSAGARDLSASTPGYLSFDGGASAVGSFNTVSGGDAGDWSSAMGYDSFDAFSYSGVVNAVSTADLRTVDAIGWNRAMLSGVSMAPVTAALAGAQGAGGLAAGAALVAVAQVGGSASDSYSYSLGGSGAGAFSLAASGSGATLAAGASGVAGAANGAFYALSVTATDTTIGASAPATPLDVIVGAGAGDTISVAALSGSLAGATPSFVYGLAGNDTIDGTGMTGRLWLDGGAGADRMTGGSGPNTYLYGAASDSNAAGMDTITNFHAAADLIDLSGLGTALKFAGKIKGSTLAAHSVGWQQSGGNTYVYANTSSATESLGSANMKIGLLGSISLGSGNIVHL